MNYKKLLFIGTVAIITACGSSKNILTADWAPEPITADGKLNDWYTSNRNYDVNTKLRYGFANDNNFLYIYFVAHAEDTQMKILFSGITIEIDTLGSKKNHVSVTYPYCVPNILGPSKDAPAPNAKDFVKSQTEAVKVTGFRYLEKESIVSIDNTIGLKGSINWGADGNMVYEVTIPIKSFYTLKSSDTVFGLKVILNAAPTPGMRSTPPGAGLSNPRMDSRMPPGSSVPPPANGPDFSDSENLFTSSSFRTSVKLVIKF